jgi:NapH/MauN family ferredoxin-type protein
VNIPISPGSRVAAGTCTPPGRAPKVKGLSRAQRRATAVRRLRGWRHGTQLAVAVLIVVAAVQHQLGKAEGAPSTDALCPFGGIETFFTWVTTGQLVSKTHPSNLILGAAVLVSILLAGNAFCGWICPFGAVQDVLSWVRRRLHLPTWTVPARLDAVLRYGRYAVLAAILVATAATAKLEFAAYDPYVTLFSLHWIFEPDLATMWPGLLVLAIVVAGSLVVDRFWCRYLCPAGAVFAVLGHLSFLRIRRTASACTDCNLCVAPCPVGIDVAKADPTVSTDCIGCLECVANCTFSGALEVSGPRFLTRTITTRATAETGAAKDPVEVTS